MALSPIEQMIDEACGVTGKMPAPRLVILRCPVCGKGERVPAHETDPANAAVVTFPHKECGGDDGEVLYYDTAGRQIDCDGSPI